MAVIRDELTIIDRFTAVFDRFINLGGNAATSMSQVGVSAEQMSANVSGAMTRATAALSGISEEQAGYRMQMQEISTAMNDQMAALADLDAEYRRVTSTQGESSSEAQRLAAQIEELTSDLDSLGREFSEVSEQAERTNKSVDPLVGTLTRLAGAYLGVQGAKKAMALSDQVSSINARLEFLVDDGGSVEQLNQMIKNSANAARADYLQVADVVARLGTQASNAFSGADETVAFVELLNKNFVLAGASASQTESAIYNLTQALSAGVLRGQDFNSVMNAAPNIMQQIADYLGVSLGELRDLAAEGTLSAQVIKDAMFASAGDINAAFEEMPMTFAQSWNVIGNRVMEMLMPLIEGLGAAADWIGQNWSTLEPIFIGLAAAVLAYAAALGIQTLATAIADGTAKAFFLTLLSNPLFWIALAIGVVIGFIYKWIQSIGGLQNAWTIFKMAFEIAWIALQIGFFTGIYWILGLVDKLVLAWNKAGAAIANFMGDMKVTVLTILQNMINGAIDIINKFINILNKIPGVNISAIEQVSFAAEAAAQNEAAKNARAEDVAALESEMAAHAAERDAHLSELSATLADKVSELGSVYADMKNSAAEEAAGGGDNNFDFESFGGGEMPDIGGVGKVGSVGSVGEVNLADEDLKMLKDIAERQYVAEVNVTHLTPDVKVEVNNNNGEKLDENKIGATVKKIIDEQVAMHSDTVYA